MAQRAATCSVWAVQLAVSRRWDLLAAVVAAGVLMVDGLDRGAAPMAIVVALSIAACLPLAWRSRAPLPVLLAVVVGLIACLVVFEPYDASIVVLMLALYDVAALGDRHRSLFVGAATAAFLVTVIVIVSPEHNTLREIGLRLVLAVGALVVGDTVRSRRELRAANRERERRIAREREQDSRRRVADERLRIARDVHDTVAHALVAINVRAGVAAHLGPGEDAGAALSDIAAASEEALNDLRATLTLLRESDDPAPTSPAPCLTSMGPLLERARSAGLEVDADVRLDGHAIASSVEHAGFRIVQEALTNVMRHANASRATVALTVVDGAVHIDVADDGDGAPAVNGHGAGHGLRGMSERVAALGGSVTAGPGEHGGWCVHARLPLTSAGRP
jgi:signal transduction histidine kinase